MSRRPAVKAANKWSRKLHRWGAIVIALPTLLVLGTGLLLQLKKQSHWIQPPTQRGEGWDPGVSMDDVLAITAEQAPEAGISTWDHVDRLDVRPGRGIVKVRGENRWEVQVDTQTRRVVQVMYRRSDLIESLHDGSFFSDTAKVTVFLANGAILLGLWITGMYLWGLPLVARRRGRLRRAAERVERDERP